EPLHPYYSIKREAELGSNKARAILSDPINYPIVVHPPDKADNFIKRCIGVSGDIIEVKNGSVYTNGIKHGQLPYSALNYVITTTAASEQNNIKEKYDVDYEKNEYGATANLNEYKMLLTKQTKDKMLRDGFAKKAILDSIDFGKGIIMLPDGTLNELSRWTLRNFRAIGVPQRNKSSDHTTENL